MRHDDAAKSANIVRHGEKEQVAGEVKEKNGVEAVVDDSV